MAVVYGELLEILSVFEIYNNKKSQIQNYKYQINYNNQNLKL